MFAKLMCIYTLHILVGLSEMLRMHAQLVAMVLLELNVLLAYT